MEVLIFSWIIYFLIVKFIGGDYKNHIRLISSFAIILIHYALYLIFQEKYINIFGNSLFILVNLFLFDYLNYTLQKKIKLFVFTFFTLLFISEIISNLYKINLYSIPFVLSILALSFRNYKSNLEIVLWNITLIIVAVSYFYNFYFYYFYALLTLFLIKNILGMYQNAIRREEKDFRLRIRKEIDSQINRQIEDLRNELEIIYKKLKEIFRLSSFTIKEFDIDSMLTKFCSGLLDLGYTGVYVVVENIQKKEGFFPNVKRFQEEIFPKLNTLQIIEDRYIAIPLSIEDKNIGYVAIYKKNPIDISEIEYLQIYTNIVTSALMKILYFTQMIKFRDLVYKTLESIDIAVAITDKDFNIEFVNESFLKMAEKKEGSIYDIIPVLNQFKKNFEDAIKNKTPFETKFSSLSRKVYELKLFPILTQDTISQVVILIEDITEKEELETQIMQTEKLAVIGRLAAGISHEIKNPLAAISQTAFSLKRKAIRNANNLKDSVIEASERIERNINRATEIINRLLNFSKPFYSKLEIVNLKDLLEEAIKLALIKEYDVKIIKNLQDINILADKNALLQVFINIIINAVEATNYKGEIIIKNYIENNNAVISIKDNGVGIPEDIVDKIFEPFFTTKEKGTGLGLSVSYRIIKDHGGIIKVNSKVGEGTEFLIILPLEVEKNE